MTTHELIELAVLDVHGLLDPTEQAAFERALAAAAPALRGHVRREQDRLSVLDDTLPDVAPSPELRTRVLEAVRAAIADDLLAGNQPRSLTIADARQVSPMWRAVAIGSIAAAVVFAMTTFSVQSHNRQLAEAFEKGSLISQITQTFGGQFVEDTLFDNGTRRVLLTAAGADGQRVDGSIFYNPDWPTTKLFSLNLASEERQMFRIAVIDGNGNLVRELGQFRSGPGLDSHEIAIDLRSIAAEGQGVGIFAASGTAGRAAGEAATPVLAATPAMLSQQL